MAATLTIASSTIMSFHQRSIWNQPLCYCNVLVRGQSVLPLITLLQALLVVLVEVFQGGFYFLCHLYLSGPVSILFLVHQFLRWRNLKHFALRTRNLSSGVRVQDIVEGEGLAANEGDVVQFNYVCRRTNGYFVYSTVDQFTGEAVPVTLPLDDKQMIKGLKDVLVGMRSGGKRRALIPPSAGYVNDRLKPIPEEFGPRRSLLSHANEPLIFEVQLLKIF